MKLTLPTSPKNHLNCKEILFLSAILFMVNTGFTQEKSPVTFGKITQGDFTLPPSKIIDGNSNGVIIADVGSISFVGNKNGWFSYIFKRKTRIKILNKKGNDLATLRIPLYTTGRGSATVEETLNDVSASTYNLENGKVVETALGKNDIFEDELDKHWVEKKITLPAVKDGCIIEYSYSINSEFTDRLPTWEFQNNAYPCLWSELNVEIPALLSYAIQKQGYDDLFINKSAQGGKNYRITNRVGSSSNYGPGSEELMVSVNTFSRRWVIKDIPALNITDEEKYISSKNNYIDKIEFQLYHVYAGQGGEEKDEYVKNWKTASAELLNQSGFGAVINVDFSWVAAKLAVITGDNPSKLERSKKIYAYIKDNFSCNNYHNYHARKSLVDVFNSKTGNVGEINLLLMCLLREAQIQADPVLISTRGNGYLTNSYSNLDKFDYVICKASIEGESFYLDASNPLLGFGKLPGYCYNGYAHIINVAHPDSVDLFPASLKEPSVVNVFIANDETKPGVITGSYEYNPNEFESYNIRQAVKGKGENVFFQTLQKNADPDMQTENSAIDSLTLTQFPVKLHYDFNFKNNGNETMYFNPVLNWSYSTNPFKSEERRFPVEMLYPIDDMYILNMEIPNGYIAEEIPKSVKVAFNNEEGFFEYIIQKNETSIQLRAHVKLQPATFSPQEYNSLRDFFAYIVKKQGEQIVFKKKK